ncbi:MAG: hypothetical protein C0399_08655 [Syntrophus sp. (in: bacteria)]|nr:hypothetical protein [Syntrophus sp. (in: bacteria)]
MDADCLIKLTKANLKEIVCKCYAVFTTQTVKKEVVDDGEGRVDALVIDANIRKGLLSVDSHIGPTEKGEESVYALYRADKFDAVCSDDKRFIKKLRLLGIPYITPAVFVVALMRDGQLTAAEAEKKLDALSPFISSDEYLTVQLSIRGRRMT